MPHVKRDGTPSGYAEAFAAALEGQGFEGWTEVQTVGHWQGKREAGTTFVIFSADTRGEWGGRVRTLDLLTNLARASAPDQDAVQVVSAEFVTLVEA
jgi:hypothetical protein